MEQDIRFLRLVTGEDIVSEVKETKSEFVLMNPMKVLYMTSSRPGYLSISLMQYVFSKISYEQVFNMPKVHVVMHSEPRDTLIKYYNETVDHFLSKRDEVVEFEEEDEDDDGFELNDEPEEDENGMKLLEDFMKSIKIDKRKLN